MSFLRSYRPLFIVYLILGLCPFSVSFTKNVIECTIWSLTYTIVLYVSLVAGVIYFWVISTFHQNISDPCDTGTCNYVLIIQALAVLIFFIVAALHTIFNRSAHVQLMNDIMDMGAKMMKHFKIEMLPTDLARTVCVRNSLLSLAHVGINVCAIFGLHMNQNVELTVYHFLFTFEISIITLTVVHVIAICSILNQSSEQLLSNIKLLLEDHVEKGNDCSLEIYQTFFLLDNINEVKIKMCGVFGIRLLANQAMDFVLVTVAVYYFLLASIQLNAEFYCSEVLVLCVYVVPLIFKNFALVRTTDTLGNQVSFVRMIWILIIS